MNDFFEIFIFRYIRINFDIIPFYKSIYIKKNFKFNLNKKKSFKFYIRSFCYLYIDIID